MKIFAKTIRIKSGLFSGAQILLEKLTSQDDYDLRLSTMLSEDLKVERLLKFTADNYCDDLFYEFNTYDAEIFYEEMMEKYIQNGFEEE